MERTTPSAPSIYKKMTSRLCNPKSDHYGGWKNMVLYFLHQKTHFDPKHLKKYFKYLVKPIHGHQKPNNLSQNSKFTQNKKIFPNSDLFFFFVFLRGKKSKYNPLII
jgi:hypothetical protein